MLDLSSNSPLILEQNLRALSARNPELANRVANAALFDLVPTPSGAPTFRGNLDGRWITFHSEVDPVVEAAEIVKAVDPGAAAVIVAGAGLGYVPVALLAEKPTRVVVVLETDPKLVRMMLSLFDVSGFLEDGVLHFVGQVPTTLPNGYDSKAIAVVRHPDLGWLYTDILEEARYVMQIGKERGRVIVLDYKLFTTDIVSLLSEQGFSVRSIGTGQLRADSFRELCIKCRPNFVFGINYSAEILLLCSLMRIPYVCWTVDPLPPARLLVLPGADRDNCLHFAHRRDTVLRLQALGFRRVFYMPVGAADRHMTVRDEALCAPFRADVSFVGSSLASDMRGLSERLRAAGASPESERGVLQWVESLVNGPADSPSYEGICEADLPPSIFDEFRSKITWDEFDYLLNGVLSSFLRLRRIRACHDLDLAVYGDSAWSLFTDKYRGIAEHLQASTLIYNGTKVNLDLPRVYQRDIVTMRVFDILQCGAFLLTEPSRDLLDMFSDGTHLVTYRSTDELRALVDHFLQAPLERKGIAEAGQRFVSQHHLLSHRLAELLGHVASLGWITLDA